VDVYHEFDEPFAMLGAITRSLKKGGRIVWVEFRGEDPRVPIKTLHKMTVEQAKKEASVFPELHWEKTIDVLPQQHIMIFRKS
jgi:ubiquinone/menaquinone biosynthesis C-methylase UbiE